MSKTMKGTLKGTIETDLDVLGVVVRVDIQMRRKTVFAAGTDKERVLVDQQVSETQQIEGYFYDESSDPEKWLQDNPHISPLVKQTIEQKRLKVSEK